MKEIKSETFFLVEKRADGLAGDGWAVTFG
jgi:hypothetical protein